MKSHALPAMGLAILALTFISPAVSRADILYSNLGAGGTYNTSGGNTAGYALDGNGVPYNYRHAAEFTSSATETFGALRIALSCAGGLSGPCSGDPLAISLATNSAGHPGSVLETFNLNSSTLGDFGLNNPLLVFNSLLHPTLTIGTQYWITVTDISANNVSALDSIAWNWNSTGDAPSHGSFSQDGGVNWVSGETPGAYEITGAVPEPASILLFGPVALLALRCMRSAATLQSRQ